MLRAGPGSVRALVEAAGTTLKLLQVRRWEHKGCREYAVRLARQVLQRDGSDTAAVLLARYTLQGDGLAAAREALRAYTHDKRQRDRQAKPQPSHEPEGAEGLEAFKSKNIRGAELMLEFHACMYGGRYSAACKAAERLALLSSTSQMFDVKVFVDAQLCRAEALVAAGAFQGAREALEGTFEVAFRSGLRGECLRALLLSGQLYLGAGEAQAALPYLLSALRQSEQMGLALVRAEAVLALSQCRRALHEGDRALALLRRHWPSLDKGSLELRARANLLLALLLDDAAAAAAAGRTKKKAAGAEAGLGEVLDHLEAAREAAARAGHTQLLMEARWLLAVTCARCGRHQERDAHAAELNLLRRGLASQPTH